MLLDNPAIYECKGDIKRGLHYWRRNEDGTAICLNCKLKLTKLQADEVWRDNG
jgi:hypothetical protein